MGLNESYAHAKSQVLMIVPVPSVNQAYAMIINVESQRMNGASTSSTEAHSETAFMSNKMPHSHSTGSNNSNSGAGGNNMF